MKKYLYVILKQSFEKFTKEYQGGFQKQKSWNCGRKPWASPKRIFVLEKISRKIFGRFPQNPSLCNKEPLKAN